MAVLLCCVSLSRWHFLGRCCSLHSLGRLTWSQCSLHAQSLWGVATFHIGKQAVWAVGSEDARAARNGGSRGPGSQGSHGLGDRQTLDQSPLRSLHSARPPSLPPGAQGWLLWMTVPSQNATIFGAAVTTPWIQKETNKGPEEGADGLGFAAGRDEMNLPVHGGLTV